MRLTRSEFADFVGYSEHEVAQFIAEGMPVRKRFGFIGQVEIIPHEAVPWILRRAGASPEPKAIDERRGNVSSDSELDGYLSESEVLSAVNRVLAEVLDELPPEEVQRLAGKSPKEIYWLLRKDARLRVRRLMERLREELNLDDDPENGGTNA